MREQLGESQATCAIGMMVIGEVCIRQSVRVIKELTSIRALEAPHKGFELGLHRRAKKCAVS